MPFTGARSNFFDPTREQMKKVAISCGISTPAWVVCKKLVDIERAAKLTYPLIVKVSFLLLRRH